jgi:hypothetical protein
MGDRSKPSRLPEWSFLHPSAGNPTICFEYFQAAAGQRTHPEPGQSYRMEFGAFGTSFAAFNELL